MGIRLATFMTVVRAASSSSSLAFTAAAALSMAAAWPGAATARTWHVTADKLGDAPTVQAGIDSASVGDVVLVGPGTYRERITFLGKDITVRSESGPELTILDATGKSGSVVRFENGETRAAVLEGFTVTGGSGEPAGGSSPNYWGGGIYMLHAAPVIRDNIVTANLAKVWGGGIYSAANGEAGPLIEGNVVRNNQAWMNGGGILMEGGTIRGNVVMDNRCDDDGGGIWVWTSVLVNPVIESNVIVGNYAYDHGGGTAYSVAHSAAVGLIRGNVVAHNYAGGTSSLENAAGGGIAVAAGGTVTIRSNTIVYNDCPGTMNAWGAGISTLISGTFLIERNIIAHSLRGGGIYCYPGLETTIRNNLAWDNADGHGIGDCIGWEQTNGNVVADPQLCDADAGDYTVARLSPALTHSAGPLGAFPDAGCDETPVERTSWGRLKQLYD